MTFDAAGDAIDFVEVLFDIIDTRQTKQLFLDVFLPIALRVAFLIIGTMIILEEEQLAALKIVITIISSKYI